MGEIKEDDVVLDFGSGAEFDCFLAAKKVGARKSRIMKKTFLRGGEVSERRRGWRP